VSRADDLRARAYLERVEHENDGVRAVGDADGLADAEIACCLLLERADIRTEHELPALEDAVDRLPHLREERRVLCLDVDERDRSARCGHRRRV
jgi:hypothetical protein